MRLGLIALVLLLAGCVSNSQPSDYDDNFDRKEAAKTRMSLGLTYLKNNNYTQAKVNLDRALEFNPRSAEVHYAIAYYYQLVGESQRAEESYETALALAPNNGDIANSYGAFKCQTGNYEDAKIYFLKAVNNRQYANSAETYENLALCAQSQGNVEDAISYLQSALNHQPSRAKSLYLLTELYMLEEQWPLAKATLTKYERVTQVSPQSIMLAVDIERGLGNIQGAKEYGEMLVSMFPTSPLAKKYLDTNTKQLPQVEKKHKPSLPKVDNNKQVSSKPSKTSNENSKLSTQTHQFHIVKSGENLYRISLMYNIKMSTLHEWNNLDKSGSIFAGMKLWLVPQNMQEE